MPRLRLLSKERICFFNHGIDDCGILDVSAKLIFTCQGNSITTVRSFPRETLHLGTFQKSCSRKELGSWNKETSD